MAYGVNVKFPYNLKKKAWEQTVLPFNRWHPEVPMVEKVKKGEVFSIEIADWTGGQIKDNDSANDVRDVELEQVHYLAGPFYVEGAEPGDLLVVDILDIGMLPGPEGQYGFTGVFAKENGGGFLVEHFPDAKKAIWNYEGIYCKTRHIEGVRFAGLTHPGLIGTLPSQKLLDTWNKRERALFESNPNRVPPLCALPNPDKAMPGTATGDVADRIRQDGARTVPGREHGGNCDIKNLSRGSRVYFPVFVKGGGLGLGDFHFSQGDGEVSFCGAVETAAWADLCCDVIKGGVKKYAVTNPIFQPGPVEPRYSEYLVFEGISVDEFEGKVHYMDAHIAYRRACLNAIEYLKTFGYTGEQAYLLLSCCPCEGRVSGIVDIPHAVCTLAIPTEIFDFDIKPSGAGPSKKSRGKQADCT
jgi:formamidase